MSRTFSNVYELGDGKVLAVDQSGINGDKTALCFARFKEGKIKIIKNQLIEQREDIEEFINTNMQEIYGVFSVPMKLF